MLRARAKLLVLGFFVLCGCAASSDNGGSKNDDEDGEGGAGGSPVTSSASGMGGDSSGPVGAGGGDAGNICNVAAMQESDATCKVAVSVDNFMVSSETCFVDSPLVNGTSGELTFACGDGPATLTFPSYVFNGTSSACTLNLLLKTQFDYTDGCTWESTQTIVGHMNGDLTYSYSEKPVSGSSCNPPCTVTATLLLEQASPVDVEPK